MKLIIRGKAKIPEKSTSMLIFKKQVHSSGYWSASQKSSLNNCSSPPVT